MFANNAITSYFQAIYPRINVKIQLGSVYIKIYKRQFLFVGLW